MGMDITSILRRIDRGALRDAEDLVTTPETASELLIGHLKLFLEQFSTATYGMKPGQQRLMLAMEIYWEGNFRRRHLRTHCLEMLREHPAFERVKLHGESILQLIDIEMKSCGIEPRTEHAPEFMRRMRDVARQELLREQRLPELRHTQYEWLEALCLRARYRAPASPGRAG